MRVHQNVRNQVAMNKLHIFKLLILSFCLPVFTSNSIANESDLEKEYMTNLMARSVGLMCQDKWFLETYSLSAEGCGEAINPIGEECIGLMETLLPDFDSAIEVFRSFGELYSVCLHGTFLINRMGRN